MIFTSNIEFYTWRIRLEHGTVAIFYQNKTTQEIPNLRYNQLKAAEKLAVLDLEVKVSDVKPISTPER